MKDKFLAAVHDYNMLSCGDTVVVGVSGGADSMCLLSLMSSCAAELEVDVIAAHFNHGIRGEEALRDEMHVRKYCENNNIRFISKTADVPTSAQESGESLEECARRLRYEFLFSVSDSAKIATAHTASDSIETVLMNFSRGSGTHGLCGIPAVRDNIIRPLIYFTREDTEYYCEKHSIEYVTDSTNYCTDYTRNAFRLNVIPEIKKINTSFSSNALRCMRILSEEDAYLRDETEKNLKDCRTKSDSLDVKKLSLLHPAMLRRVVMRFVSERLKHDVSYKHIEIICKIVHDGHGAIELPFDEKLDCSNGNLFFARRVINTSKYLEIPVLEQGGKYEFYGRTAEIQFVENDESIVPKKDTYISAMPDLFSLTVRSRKDSDRISPVGRKCTKTIKKLFYEAGIPQEKRNAVMLIADKDGIIFADGFGIDASRIPEKKDRIIMIIKTGGVNNE